MTLRPMARRDQALRAVQAGGEAAAVSEAGASEAPVECAVCVGDVEWREGVLPFKKMFVFQLTRTSSIHGSITL